MTATKRTKEDLLQHDVVINGSVVSDTSTDIPRRVKDTIRVLLDFTSSIHIDWQDNSCFRDNLDALSRGYRREGGHCLMPPETAFFGENQPAGLPKSDRERQRLVANEEVCECIDIAKGFKKHERQMEDDLTDRYRFAIFRGPDQLYTSYAKKSKITWTLHRNVPWSESFCCFQSEPKIPRSTPDVFYGLRVIRSSTDDMLISNNPAYSDNLTIDILGTLRNIGVPSTVTSALRTTYNKDLSKMTASLCALDSHHLSCFPFAVVELKKELTGHTEVEVCECQAASASVRALSLYKLIYEEAYRNDSPRSSQSSTYRLPPVVAFTCVGSKVRVWLTYQGRGKTIMRCIYSTDVVLAWGVLSLRRIVKNMLSWQEHMVARYLSAALDRLRDLKNIGRGDTIYEEDGTTQHNVQDVLAPDRVLSQSPEPVETPTPTHVAGKADVDLHDDGRKQFPTASESSNTSPRAQPSSASAQSTTPQAHLLPPQTPIRSMQAQSSVNDAQSSPSSAQRVSSPVQASSIPAKADSILAQPSTTRQTRQTSKRRDKTINFIFGSPSSATPKSEWWSHPSHIKMPSADQRIFSSGNGFSASSISNSDPFISNLLQRPAASSPLSEDAGANSTTAKSSSPGHGGAHQHSRNTQLQGKQVRASRIAVAVKPPSRSSDNSTGDEADSD